MWFPVQSAQWCPKPERPIPAASPVPVDQSRMDLMARDTTDDTPITSIDELTDYLAGG
jgi:hypothetical protein